MVELHTADVPTMRRAAEVLGALGLAEPATDPSTRRCSIAAPGGAGCCPMVVRALDDAAVAVEDISLRRPTLDEVFLALTGHRSRHDDRRRERRRRDDNERRPMSPRRTQHDDIEVRLGPGQPGARGARRPTGASSCVASARCAARTLKKFVRTPALIVAGTAQGACSCSSSATSSAARSRTRVAGLRRLPGAGLRRDRRAVPGHGRSERHGRGPAGRLVRPAAQLADPAAARSSPGGSARQRARGLGRASS